MTAVPLTFGKLHRGLTQIAGLREFRVSAGFVDEMARVYALADPLCGAIILLF
jgi:hypothetical protein